MLNIEKILVGGIKIFRNPMCNQNNLFCGFTTRDGGSSRKPFNSLNLAYHVGDDDGSVLKNRQLIINKLLGPGLNISILHPRSMETVFFMWIDILDTKMEIYPLKLTA